MKTRLAILTGTMLILVSYYFFATLDQSDEPEIVRDKPIPDSSFIDQASSKAFSDLSENDRFEFYKSHIKYQAGETSDAPLNLDGFAHPPDRKWWNVRTLLLQIFESGDYRMAIRLLDEVPIINRDWIILEVSKALPLSLGLEEIREILIVLDYDPAVGSLLHRSIVASSKENPMEAANWALTLPSDYIGSVLASVFMAWARVDQDFGPEALDFLSKLDDSVDIDLLLIPIMRKFDDDPALVLALSRLMRSDELKAAVCEGMASKNYEKKNYEEWYEWKIREMEHNPRAKDSFDVDLRSWAESDPQAALEFIESKDLQGYNDSSSILNKTDSNQSVDTTPVSAPR